MGTDFLLVKYLKTEDPKHEPPAPMSQVFAHPALIVYGFGGFLINFFMSIFFFNFPLIVTGQHHLKMTHYYMLLLPMMVISAFTMFGFSQGADKGWARFLAAFAYVMFIPSFLLLFEPAWVGFSPLRLLPVFVSGVLFYIGFTGLEPILPSLVSKTSGPRSYGTALGFYNTAQFVGSAVGGPLAGFLASYSAEPKVLVTVGAAAIGFLLMAATKAPVRVEPAVNTP